ncbi:MAG: ABC transporter ATP-binding protein [Bacteroidetes bacterium]|nr:MAG: ABC transporter ATP-binding protein [Bacteroidota bacterium]
MLKASNIKKTYTKSAGKELPVLKGVSLELKKGEFVALMGPSGVGKSTLLHLLGSLDKPDSGDILLNINGDSCNYTKMNDTQLSKVRNNHIGFVFQFHHLLPEFTSLENVMMPALINGKSFSLSETKAKELLAQVGISERHNHKPSELSGGEQQRVAIARALINEPAIIFADEPTGNLDSANANSILELIISLRKERQLTILIATHSQQIADASERILTMGDGLIVNQK